LQINKIIQKFHIAFDRCSGMIKKSQNFVDEVSLLDLIMRAIIKGREV